jgi:fengycin family lipopeptide synthetase D
MKSEYSNLLDVIRDLRSSDRGITFISRHGEDFLAYAQLFNQAMGLLKSLQSKGMKPNDELLFQLDDNRSFLVVFWACILGGIIPVPVTSGNNEEHRLKLQRVWHVLNKPYLVTTQQTFEQIERFASQNNSFHSLESMRQNLIIIEELDEWDGEGIPHTVLPDDIALIQFSSGSTGEPKGVTLTHRNILCNINAIIIGANIMDTDSSLSWMPLTHDMGLIGFHLSTMTANIHQYMMPPALFILAPELWMDKAHEHKVTFLSSPNFGYKHFLNHYKAEATRQWSFSHLRLLFNGAEPISKHLSEQFLDAMEPYGMARNVMFPVYGMAEASLAVTFPPIDEVLIPVHLDRGHVSIGEAIREIDPSEAECVTFVDVGYPVNNCSIRICDDDSTKLAEGYVGNIHIKGNNVTQGYYNNPQATKKLLTEDGWLNTGDLGFIRNGRLVITGRKKDIIFIRGQNYYPHDLEAIAQSIPGIELGKIAMCGVSSGEAGIEEIAAFVLFRGKIEKFIDQVMQLKKVFNKATGLELRYVIPVRSIPKTTSGKLQRYKLAEQHERGEFTSVIAQIDSLIDQQIRQGEIVSPESTLEHKLLELWMEVLGRVQISVHDHFFELGGDSLKAALLLNRIHRQFQIEIPASSLYEISTIRLIANYMQDAKQTEYTPIPVAEHRNYYPLSPAQYRVYIQEQFEGIGVSYNMPMVMHIEGNVDLAKVEQVFQQLVDRHEILRTSFIEHEGDIVQVIHKDQVIKLTDIHIDNVNELQAAIDGFIRPFDLGIAPLIRIGMITEPTDGSYHLVVDMHHMISDGISTNEIIHEFTKLYQGERIPEPSLQYKDYVMWQHHVIQADRHQQKQYWQNQLSDDLPILEMPTDYNRVDQRSFRGDSLQFLIPDEMVKRLNDLALHKRVTLNTLLVSIYAIVLSKYTRQQQVVIGSLVSGRNHAELASMLGMFINYIPLRIQLEPAYTYSEYLERCSNMMSSAYHNQDYPYESMITDLPARTPQGRNPIFDTMLIVHNQMDVGEVKHVGELKLTFDEWSTNTAKLDIKLDVFVDKAKGLVCRLEYNRQLFKRETVERLSQHYMAIMDAVLINPYVHIGQIDMLSNQEREQIVQQFNGPINDLPQKGNVTHQWVEAAADRQPDHIAVMLENNRISYRELNERANQLARVLNMNGVTRNRIAAIIIDRSIEMMVGILAIMKAGGAYLPISPEYPRDRQRFMLEDSEAVLVLTNGRWMNDLEFDGVIVNMEDESFYQGDSSNLPLIVQPEDLAYVIYTSGSTGNPKGVMIEHAGVVNRIEWMHEQYPIRSNDVILQKTAFTFDVSVWELFWWSLAGATVSFLQQGGEKDPETIVQTIEEHQVTTMHFVPSMLHLFLAHLERHESREQVLARLASLKYVFASGEALPVQHVERFYRLFEHSSTKLINLYGPTEASIDVSYYDCVPGEQLESIPIGKPIANTQLYIVDDQFQLLPIGVPGELCIAGVGLARGYIGLPEMNATKFIANPFAPGTRMYRTGDLARWLPDGTISYMGRLDHQVKLRGYRIELGEIEAGLMRHKDIVESVVLVKEAADGDKYLSAYIVTTKEISVADIRKHLSTMMPDYMIPAHYCELDSMPLTSNSKVDRKALAKLEGNVQANEVYVAPQSEVEVKLAEIWCKVLQISRVGITDHFFEIGGHSLKATEMLHLIHKELGVSIPLRAIFNHPTIQALALVMMDHHDQVSTFQSIQQAEPAAYYPLSPAQSRLYVLHQFDGIGTAYHLPVTLICEGTIDLGRFEQAMKQIIHRHESLRTSFELVDGVPVQRIHSHVSFAAQHWTDKQIPLAHIIQEFIRPFDLTNAPLLRAGIVQQSDEQQFILFDMHHIVSDGLSMGIVVNDFIRLYEGQQLESVPIQYKDFAVWQMDFMKSEALKAQEQYWLNTFVHPLPVLNFPTDFNRQPLRSFEGHRVCFEMDEQLTHALRLLAAETQSTLYMVLLAVFNIVLSRYSGQDDIIIGTPVSGRPHADLYSIIGMFVNTIPLRNRPTADRTFNQFMHELRDGTLSAFDNQHYPFEELVGKLQLNRNLSRNPLFDVMFVMQNMNIPELSIDSSHMKLHEFQHTSSKFDFTLEVMETNDGLSCHFEYCTKLFYRETVEMWVQHYLHVIKEVLANPNIQLGDIRMISQEESINLINGSHGKQTNYPQHTTLHQLFEEQVARTPDHIAIVFEDEQLTYDELNVKANRIAHLLRSKGVNRDQPVGLMVDRSLDMVISMLAILKAGGAYVPIDPAYPVDRIQYMIDNSDVRLVLAGSQYVNTLQQQCRSEIIDISSLPDQRPDNLPMINEIDDLAYIIYTSGTTGRPKGVMIEHRNVIRLLINDHALYDFNDQDVWTMFHSFCFDISVWEMYGALLYGGKLVVFSKQTAQDPQQFLDLMVKERVTVLNQTPSAFYPLIPYEISRSHANLQLRYIIFGGEALKPAMLKPWKQRYPDTQLINMYGITETTVHSTFKEITLVEIEDNVSNIGVPIPTLSCYILNNQMQLLPRGVIGELYVGGDGVARGYMNNEQLTSERFVSNPFIPEQRLYRSGDLAKWLPSGELEYYGRIDHQVKIRGFRIELSEIESSLLRHPEISASVVLVKESDDGDKQLWAYVATDNKLTISNIRKHLSDMLPDYMVPAFYVQLEEIPLTVNGKVDRNALLRIDASIRTNSTYTAPGNELEQKLTVMWRQLLGLEEISIHDNFFEIGGHSLLLIRMHHQLEAEFAGIVKVTDLFAYTTIHKLAAFIEAETSSSTTIVHAPTVQLPQSFFVARQDQQPSASFNYQLDSQFASVLRQMASSLDSELDPILAIVYVYVLAQFTKIAQHAISLMTQDQKVHVLDIDLGGELDVSRLVHLIRDTINDQMNSGDGVPIRDRIKSMPQSLNDSMYPLLYNNNQSATYPNLNESFDLLVSYRSDHDQITLYCDFNGRRLRKEKVKEFFQGYVKLLRLLSNQHSNVQETAVTSRRGATRE